MTTQHYRLSDEQWARVFPLLPPKPRPRRPREPEAFFRRLLDTVYHKWMTGCSWTEIPPGYVARGDKLYYYYRAWTQSGVLGRVRRELAPPRTSTLPGKQWERVPSEMPQKILDVLRKHTGDNVGDVVRDLAAVEGNKRLAQMMRAVQRRLETCATTGPSKPSPATKTSSKPSTGSAKTRTSR